MEHLGFRGLFCLAVAASAAALTDPLVEAASNAGWFGRGTFTDYSTIDVVPALVAAAVLALAYVLLRSRPFVTPKSLTFARRMRDSLRAGAARPVLPLLPVIFASQLGALYGMETLEQIAIAGHPLGGTIWLGAPVFVALTLHGGACVLVAYALAHALHALTRAVVDIALYVRAILVRRPRDLRRSPQLWLELPAAAPQNPLGSRSGTRAPPFLFA
jgi:hypothetical protein